MDRREKEQTIWLKVATLNYSGIITSPYQYHENEEDEQEILRNRVFSEMVKKFYQEGKYTEEFDDPKKFAWCMGSIDVIWKNRLSPANWARCGVNEEKHRMMTLSQFQAEWDNKLQASKSNLLEYYKEKNKKKNLEQITSQLEQHLRNAKRFDIICYRTFAKLIYGAQGQAIEKWQQSPEKWIQQREQDFDKSFLNQDKKMRSTLNILQKQQYDILCFQQTNKEFRNLIRRQLPAYWMRSNQEIKTCDSIILLKKSTFPEIKEDKDLDRFNNEFIEEYVKVKAVFTVRDEQDYDPSKTFFDNFANQKHFSQVKQKLVWNTDSVMQIVRNLVVFSPHISSKKEKNFQQQKQMKTDIEDLKKYNPQYSMICAGDLNSQIKDSFQIKGWAKFGKNKILVHVYPPPGSKEHITCNKKRTLLQPQRHKAQILDKGAKDYIVTDMTIEEKKIMMIDGEEIQPGQSNKLLPTHQHPYDHYVTSCNLRFTRQKS